MLLGKLDRHMQKNKTRPLSDIIHDINSKGINTWIPETWNHKILGRKHRHRRMSLTLYLVMFPVNPTKGKGNKSKNKQMGLHQTKKLLHKENIKMTGKPPEWVHTFANHIANKRLILQIQRIHTTQNEFFCIHSN